MTQRKYPETTAKLKEVVDATTYDLLPAYSDLFKPASKNNKESIFEVQYKKGSLGEGSNFSNVYAPENSGNAVIQFGGGGNNKPTPDIENAYEAGDPRKALSFASSYTNAAGNKVDYYFTKKYADVPTTNGDGEDNFYEVRINCK